MFLLLLIIILSIPAVQTRIAKKVTNYLNESYGTDINIDRLGLNWKAEVDIRGIYIADHHKDTLIFANQLQTNILSVKRLIDGDLDFGHVNLSDAKFYLKVYEDEVDDNLFVFTEKFDTGTSTSVKPFHLATEEVTLTNTKIRYIDENEEKQELFNFTNVNLNAQNFNIEGPVIKANIQRLALDAKQGYSIKSLAADFAYTLDDIILKDLVLVTEESKVIGEVILHHGVNGFPDFNNKMPISAHFEHSNIATNDLNTFYNEFGKDMYLVVDGEFEGTLNDFTFKEADLSFQDISIKGDFKLKNLLKDDEYVIEAKNHNISANYYDLKRFLPRVLSDLPKEIKDLGRFNLRGNTTITNTTLNTNSVLNSKLGRATTNFEMGNINDFDNAFYEGNVQLQNFKLSKIAQTESLGLLTANLNFKGRGFTQNTVNTEISGVIDEIEFEGYTYQNSKVTGNLKNPIFNGELSIDDPNLKLNFKGLVDVSKEMNKYNFEADVEFAELNKLNLIKRDSVSIFAGKINMDMYGTTVDDAVGTINFKETFYQNLNEDYYFDDFMITSSFEKKVRTIQINSPDIINGKITGEFLVEDIPSLFRNGIGSIYTNYIAKEVTINQYIDYDFEVYNKIVDVFVPQLKLGDNTKVKGSVSSDESKFKLNFNSPELLLYENYLSKVKINVDNDNPLFNTYISIDSVYTGFYNVTDVNFINKTLNDTLYIRSEFKGGKRKEDLFNLSLYHTINPEGKSVVGVKKSDITYKDNVWHLNENNNHLNKVVFDDNFKTIHIDSLVLNHNEETIRFAGVLKDTTYKNIRLSFSDVNIGNLMPEIDSLSVGGNINGKLNFVQKRGFYYPNSNVVIDGVTVNDIEFGDLSLLIEGNKNLTKYNINSTLINENVESIVAIGEIDDSGKHTELNLNVDLKDFNLAAFSPLGGEEITNIRGLASGNVKVNGRYNSPSVFGNLTLNESGLKIPYLNTDFDLQDNTMVVVTEDNFDIYDTNLTDTKYNTSGVFSGNISHQNFQDWHLNFHLETDRMLVLDTPPDEDELYYGTAFISGTADIIGNIDELVIDVVAATEEGTSFKIPISDTESIGDDSFIKFISPEEKQAILRGETIVSKEVKGLSLNFELDINKNAEVEVVVDKENNSTLRGRGAGTLLLEINTLGKFKMWGDFIVYEGVYDFRYGGLIQKEIDVERDGTITWDGSPTKAQLNLRAIYKTNANPSVLLDNPSINRKIPVNVIVDLTGEILQPNLDFTIDFPRVSSIVKSELDYKLQDRQQRENQALFLISTGSFVGDGAGQSAITGTLAERINGIVAELFSDSNSKFKVLPYYNPGDRTINQETSDELGFAISTQISERIIINGKVGIPVGGVNESAVAGDVEVQWLVNEDGSLRINFFNRQADLQFIGEDQIFEQGAGVSYSVDFDTMKELIDKIFGKEIDIEEIQIVPEDSSPVNFTSPKKDEN
ncbi:MAG: translocation/assembly module TamB [Flavobacteriaceae bacterium]|nr:translocation/assembly module TamB [Flavobacteriaceae bacterium]